MAESMRARISGMLGSNRRHVLYLRGFALLAVVVAMGVALVLRQTGVAMTHAQTVLDCQVAGEFAHTHNADCYNDDGELVCPLPERPLHMHTDACYDDEGRLVCGLDELIAEHVHGPGCFVTVTVPDDNVQDETDLGIAGDSDFTSEGATQDASIDGVNVGRISSGAGGEQTSTMPQADTVQAPVRQEVSEETAVAFVKGDVMETDFAEEDALAADAPVQSMPAQSFVHVFKDQDKNALLTVAVDAPEGALPAGATMQASWIGASELTAKERQAIEGAVAEKAEGAIVGQQAVDISFRDAAGIEVEPAEKITVTLTSALVDTQDRPLLVHVDDLTEDQLAQQERALARGKTAEQAEPARTAQVVDALGEEELASREMAAESDQLVFESDAFSTYVLVVTTLQKQMVASDGNTYTVTVDAPAEAGITQDAELQASEIFEESPAWASCAGEARDALGWGASLAKVLDISIVSGGAELQPSVPVSVSIALTDAGELGDDVCVAHFGQQGMELVDATVSGDTVSFEADGFSAYAIIETTIEQAVLASDGQSYRATATYGPESGIPADARLNVQEVVAGSSVYGSYVAAAESALGWEPRSAGYVRLFDIAIVDRHNQDVKYQPASGTTVDVRIELVGAESDELNVVHFANSSRAGDVVESTTEAGDEGKVVGFKADGFSVYAVVDESTETNARMKLEFYSKGNLIATMYVKNGDVLLGNGERDPYKQYVEDVINDPGVGVLETGESFAGWILDKSADYTTADIDDAMTIEQIRQWAVNQSIQEGETTHRFDAAICKHYTITYKDENGTVLGMDAVPVKSDKYGIDYVSRTVNMAYTPKDDVHNFEGWTLDEGSEGNVSSTIPTDRKYANGQSISIKGDISFTVNAPAGNWLIFDENGKGGVYNAPQFVKSGEVTAAPRPDSEMTRNGYTFGGWYDTKEHADAHGANPNVTTGKFTFGNELHEKTTLYASWIPNTRAPYTVILWGQNADRTAYEVLGSYVNNNGVVGQNIPYTFVNNGDEDYVTGVGTGNGHYTGFSLISADANQQVVITPEGDAVLNLHYNRILYNFKFYLYRNSTQNNRYDYANNSGSGSSLDDLVTWHSNQTQHPSVTGETIQSETVGGRTYYYFILSAYYGEDISSKWPTYDKITGANGREAVSYVMMVGTKLKPNPTNQGSGTVKGIITILDDNILGATNDKNGNYVIIRFPDRYNNWRYHIWFETVEGEDYTGKTLHTHNGKTYYEETVLTVRSSNTTDANQNEPKYGGFEYITRLGQNNSGTTWQGGHWTTTEGGTTLYHLNYIYDRQKFEISYFDGNYVDGNGATIQNRAVNLLHTSQPIEHGAQIPIHDREYVPNLPEGEEGYIFEGWYLDEGCTTPYNWNTMPIGGIKVYAKWRQVQYRVFLHPNAGTDPSLDWGSTNVSTSFRVSYGDKVSTPTGKRENSGYEFVGWYTDPSMSSQYLYNPDTVLNDETVTTPYDKTEDTELDKWGNVKAGYEGENADSGRPWITKKLDLYAKWRKILEGAGINVVYTANDGQGHVGSNAPEDGVTYPDQADASAQAACTPPNGMYFKHWVIQTWNEEQEKYVDTDITVSPGQQFTVDEQHARKEAISGTNEYKYTMQLRAEYGQPGEGSQTHIWWFDNYSENGSERHESSRQDNEITINEAKAIKEPPTREGYTFLGWARIPRTTSDSQDGTPPTGKVLDLTANDLYLKYENNQFKLNDSSSNDNGKVVTQVAADEKLDYHDMYAVWKKNTYKVTIKKVVVGSETTGPFTIGYVFDDTALQPGSVSLSNGQSQELTVDIPHGTTITLSETAEGYSASYGAVRTTNPGGIAINPPVSVDEETSGAFKIKGNTTITVTNSPQAKRVKVYKVDDSDEPVPLQGVGFTLGGITLTSGVDGCTNTVSLNVSVRPYILQETAPIPHYIGLGETTVPVTVANTGITIPDNIENVSISEPDADGVYTITVVNPRERHTVTVVKRALGTDADKDAEYGFTATGLGAQPTTFSLHGRQKTEVAEGVTTVTQANSKVFENVPYGTIFSVAETAVTNFETAIVVAIDGEEGDPISGVATGDITVNGDVVITYSNTRKSQPVSVWKTDMDHNALTGASFSLYKAEDFNDTTGEPKAGATAVTSGTVGTNGILSLEDVATGEYRLVETQAPAGYNRAGSAIKITVEPQAVAAFQDGSRADVVQDGNEYWVAGQEPGTWQVRVWNNPGVELPAAGGVGTLPLTVVGVALMLAGAVHLAWFNRFRASNLGAAHR